MEHVKNSSLVLAYLGDAVYEVRIRKHLIEKNIVKVNDLQNNALNYVSAKKQAYFLNELITNNFFNEAELNLIKNARNSKSHSKPKNCDILTYKHATAFEAVIGYFEITKQCKRIDELIEEIIKM